MAKITVEINLNCLLDDMGVDIDFVRAAIEEKGRKDALNIKNNVSFKAEIILLQTENKLLKNGRKIIIAQAEACEFKAKKNAEAYNDIKSKNEKLHNLLNLALTALKSRGICGECKHYAANHMQGLCADCYNDTARSPCQREYPSDHWTWFYDDMLKDI